MFSFPCSDFLTLNGFFSRKRGGGCRKRSVIEQFRAEPPDCSSTATNRSATGNNIGVADNSEKPGGCMCPSAPTAYMSGETVGSVDDPADESSEWSGKADDSSTTEDSTSARCKILHRNNYNAFL